jgi:hypothetical protein
MRLEKMFSPSSSSYQQTDHFLSHPYPCHRFIITGIPTTIVITTNASHICQSRPGYYTLAHPAIPAYYLTERMHPAPINHYYKTTYGPMEVEPGTARRSGHGLRGRKENSNDNHTNLQGRSSSRTSKTRQRRRGKVQMGVFVADLSCGVCASREDDSYVCTYLPIRRDT